MLTQEQIDTQATKTYSLKRYKDFARAYALGATWANEKNGEEIAKLNAEIERLKNEIANLKK